MINREQFYIDIQADKASIWKALWDDSLYREWTKVFFEGSYMVAKSWDEGSIVHFLAPDQNGLYSRIEKHIPNEIIEFKHIGNVKEGKEQEIDEETKKWSGTTEIYRLIEKDNSIRLQVEIDIMEEYLESMKKAFDSALEIVKTNSIKA